jgi:hypothetical protein
MYLPGKDQAFQKQYACASELRVDPPSEDVSAPADEAQEAESDEAVKGFRFVSSLLEDSDFL